MTTWTPKYLPQNVLDFWIDIADTTTLTDVGSGVISDIADKSNNGRGFTQATSGKRGTRTATNTNFNNKPTLAFPAAGGYSATGSWTLASDAFNFAQSGAGLYLGANGPVSASIGTLPQNGVFSARWTAGATFGSGQPTNNNGLFWRDGTNITASTADPDTFTPSANGAYFFVGRIKSSGGTGFGRLLSYDGGTTLGNKSTWDRDYDADVGEIIRLSGSVTTAQCQKIEGYLAWKWGLQSNLPSGHPYKTAAPTIWTPADDTSGTLYGWWDIADSSSLTDAGSGVISQINDKSGNARHWTQATSGKRGTRTALNTNFNSMSTLTVPTSGGYTALSGNITSPSGLEYSIDTSDFTAGLIGALQSGTMNLGANLTPNTFPLNMIHGLHWSSSKTYGVGQTTNNATFHWRDGTALTNITEFSGGTLTPTTGGASFVAARMRASGGGGYGRFIDPATPSLLNRATDWARTSDTDFGEMILLTGVVSDALRQKYEGYLAWKWGLQANLPVGHPYLSAAPDVGATADTLDILPLDFTSSMPAAVTITSTPAGFAPYANGSLATFTANAGRRTNAGILIEAAQTNQANASQNTASKTVTRGTLSNATLTAPDGTATGNKLIETSGQTAANWNVTTGPSLTANTWTFSIYLLSNTANFANTSTLLNFFLEIDDSGFIGGAYTNIPYANGVYQYLPPCLPYGNRIYALNAVTIPAGTDWYRSTLTFKIDNTLVIAPLVAIDSTPVAQGGPATGDGTKYLGFWGLQVEQGNVATSLIPTGTTSNSRIADTVSFTIPSVVSQIRYTFDNGTTQIVNVTPGTYTIPATLNRPQIKYIEQYGFYRFNGLDKSANLVLYNNGLTANLETVSAGARYTRANFSLGQGQYYFEGSLDAYGGSPVPYGNFGIGNSSVTGGYTTGAIAASYDGNVYSSTTSVGRWTSAVPVAIDTIDCAVNTLQKLIWFRKNGGSWNANSSADPASNKGGYTYSFTGDSTPYIIYDAEARDATAISKFSIKFLANTWSRSAPQGYTDPNGNTNFTITPSAYSWHPKASTFLSAMKGITITLPAVSDNFLIMQTNTAIQLAEVKAVISGNTSPSVTYSIYTGANRDGTSNTLLVSANVCSNVTTGTSLTSFASANVAANSYVWVSVSAVSGNVADFHLTLRF